MERQAIRAEGLDPDDPAVVAAIDMVRWELSLLTPRAVPHVYPRRAAITPRSAGRSWGVTRCSRTCPDGSPYTFVVDVKLVMISRREYLALPAKSLDRQADSA
jgi:hypothetical protein